MREERGIIDAPLTLRVGLIVSGTATAPIVVEAGGHLILRGTAQAGLTVRPGGKAEIDGVVRGGLHDEGGEVLVRGMIE